MASATQLRLVQVALRLIRKEGRDVTIKRTLGETYNPITGENEKDTRIYNTVGCTTGSKSQVNGGGNFESSLVTENEKNLLLTNSVVPQIDDEIYFDDELIGTVINPIEEIKPSDVPIIFKVRVRK